MSTMPALQNVKKKDTNHGNDACWVLAWANQLLRWQCRSRSARSWCQLVLRVLGLHRSSLPERNALKIKVSVGSAAVGLDTFYLLGSFSEIVLTSLFRLVQEDKE
jgi:hypothetical protein